MQHPRSSQHAASNAASERRPFRAVWSRRLLCALVALWFALLTCTAPNRASASIPPGYHVYLYRDGQSSVDVTSTYYNSGGQDYVVYGDPIPIVVDWYDDHVYDLYNNVIGDLVGID
jgi:hypothetical protein